MIKNLERCPFCGHAELICAGVTETPLSIMVGQIGCLGCDTWLTDPKIHDRYTLPSPRDVPR